MLVINSICKNVSFPVFESVKYRISPLFCMLQLDAPPATDSAGIHVRSTQPQRIITQLLGYSNTFTFQCLG